MTAETENGLSLPVVEAVSSIVVKSTKAVCSICNEEGDGYHFGAETCRACAAFFRRSVSLDKTYLCRGNGKCEITANIRCMCRACRYTRCLEVGMNPAGVQQRRDTIGKRDIKNEMPDATVDLLDPQQFTSSVPTTSSPCPPVSELPYACASQMPILLKMRSNYGKMDSARLVIHRKDGENIFEETISKSVNYKEAAEQGIREVPLVADWISGCFDGLASLPIEQKKILFRNFYTPFCMLEGAFLCHINNNPNVIVLPSGDYIDIDNLDKFFYDPEAEQPMTADEINKCCRLFKPSFDLHRRSINLPMASERIDVYEFFALCTILFWDFGLDGQYQNCIQLGKCVKDRVIKELCVYLKCVKKMDEPSLRVATILTLIPPLQRSVRRFQEDIELTNVFKIYAPAEDFYNLVNGKFC